METWDDLKKGGSAHYRTGGVQPIDLMRDLGIFKSFALGSIIKYAARNSRQPLNPKDMEKIIHYAKLIMASDL